MVVWICWSAIARQIALAIQTKGVVHGGWREGGDEVVFNLKRLKMNENERVPIAMEAIDLNRINFEKILASTRYKSYVLSNY